LIFKIAYMKEDKILVMESATEIKFWDVDDESLLFTVYPVDNEMRVR